MVHPRTTLPRPATESSERAAVACERSTSEPDDRARVERGVGPGPGGVVFAGADDSHACAGVVAEALPWRSHVEIASLGQRVEAFYRGLASSTVAGLGMQLTRRISTTMAEAMAP